MTKEDDENDEEARMKIESDWPKPQPEQAPRPTYAPALMAGGLMFLLWGAATAWPVSLAGLLLIGIASVRWIRDLQHGD
jgi:hypothetical protein